MNSRTMDLIKPNIKYYPGKHIKLKTDKKELNDAKNDG
jgi:hypothetical protein